MNGGAKDSEKSKPAVDSSTERPEKTGDEKQDGAQTEGSATEGKKKESRKDRGKKSRNVEVPDDGVPYDRGWAWMIVLAGFLNFVVAAGYNRSMFIFFVSFLEEFQAPVTETALLFGVKAGINSIVGLFIMNAVVGRFGVRKTVFIGGVCISLSAILGSFATDITSLILSQAVFHGLGMSMLNMPTTVLLGFYFRRRRSLANSITKCGVGVGAVAFPPIATFFLDRYGLRGALLLMGGISLHTLVAALLLRPTSFYKKKRNRRLGDDALCDRNVLSETSTAKRTEEEEKRTPCNEKDNLDLSENNHSLCNRDVEQTDRLLADELKENKSDLRAKENSHSMHEGRQSVERGSGCVVIIEQEVISPFFSSKHPTSSPVSYPLLDAVDISKSAPNLNNSVSRSVRRRRTSSFNDSKGITVASGGAGRSGDVLDALSQSHVVRYMSAPDLELDSPCVVFPSVSEGSRSDQDSQHRPSRTCLGRAWHVLGKVVCVLDFGLFHSPMFRLLVVFFVTSPMVGAAVAYLPAMATERGLDDQQRAILLSVVGGLDLCCRLACGFVADLKIIKVSTMIAISFTVLGVVDQLTSLMTSFPLLIGLAVAQGLLTGVAACLMPILIMEDIGLENTAKALGFNKLFSGAAMAAFHPLLGYIRDSTGSYDVAYNVIGAMTLMSAAVIFCLRFLPHRLPPPHASSARDTHVQNEDDEEPEESSPLRANDTETDNHKKGSREKK